MFEQRGELSAAVELRRLFRGFTDNAQAREYARTIAGWKPLRPVKRVPKPRHRGARPVPLPHILTIGAWTVAILGLIAPASHAMQMQVAGNQLILSGNVVGDEPSLIADILSKNPAIDTVILRNSRGGDVAAGYRVGEMFRARGLRTAVSGNCNSSCSRMFLGGKERFFTSDGRARLDSNRLSRPLRLGRRTADRPGHAL